MTDLRDKIAETARFWLLENEEVVLDDYDAEELADAILAMIREGAWQPIATAPKNGTEIVGLSGRKTLRLCWWFQSSSDVGGFLDENGRPFEPHHWAHLPRLPSSPESSGVEP